jgi:zinc/manganese transport system ATP-binding protein/zinc transport system ATP-binding protein
VTPVVEFEHVFAGYDRARPVVRDVSFVVERGDFAGLIGPSGSGKTTLLRAMLGMAPSVSGQIRINGVRVSPGDSPAGASYVPQTETIDWTFPVTVEQVVLMGRVRRMGVLPWPSRSDRADVSALLERLGIAGLERRQIRELSGGQQQRTFLARALIADPDLLVLDEPTSSVDIKTRDDILHLLAHLNRDGVTIVMTTHELNTVAAHLPRVICVRGGIVAQGRPHDVFTPEILSETFQSEMRVVHDTETGALLVAEAGSHRPFAEAVAR